MSTQHFLSKAGEGFKKNLKDVPKHRIPHYLKLYKQTQPKFMARSRDIEDFRDTGEISSDFKKLKYLVGDRVVIVKGPKTGNICKVTRHLEYNSYLLDENGPMSTLVVPKQFWSEGQKSHVVTFPKSVKEDNIRLVADIEGEDGKSKTVAIDNLEFKGRYFDEDYKKVIPYRSVYGQPDMIIPWPRPEPMEDGPQCTKVADVNERSYFVESVVRDSIPEEALLTIRNPNSKWRRGQLTRTEVRKLTPPEMPLTETKKAYLQEREELKKLNKINITDEMKEYLGKKIRDHEAVKAQQLEKLLKLEKLL